MNHNARSIFLIILLILSALLLPALVEASLIELPEEDDFVDEEGDDFTVLNSFSTDWTRIPVHRLSILLRLGISFFALFVVYLGGRSKHRRFNDRTIDHGKALIAFSFKTALLNRAVFVFLFIDSRKNHRDQVVVNDVHPILIPNPRRSL